MPSHFRSSIPGQGTIELLRQSLRMSGQRRSNGVRVFVYQLDQHHIARMTEVLSRLVSLHGTPLFMRSDNGPEFVNVILEWISSCDIATVLNDPSKPWKNGSDESFNGKFRDECLPLEWFCSLREAAVLIESWCNHYNEVRPHSSRYYLTPAEFKQQLRQDLQSAPSSS